MSSLRCYVEGRLYDRAEDPKMPPRWAMNLVVAQADDGDMYLPCLGRRLREHAHSEPWWDRPLNLKRPAHWPYALFSLFTGWVMWVEPC